MKNFTVLFFVCISISALSQQVSNVNNFWYGKEFSKEIALYDSKDFLFKNVLGSSSEAILFELTPIAAASSGELTTLFYRCVSKQKEGLILGFYGTYWNEAGVVYQGYGFKNLEKDQAIEFLNKIQQAIDDNANYLATSFDINNIYFTYNDINVLIWSSSDGSPYSIRLFWNGFDSNWDKVAFNRSKKRFVTKTQ
jgi:hypothetical protein